MRAGPSRWVITMVMGGSVLACASAGWPPLVGPAREQPASLIGRWVAVGDAAQAGALRGEWLVLLADGEQWTERALDSARAGLAERDSPRAWWRVYRGADGAVDQLCLHWRGGRHPADCASYQLDTIRVSGRPVRRLRWGGAEWVAAH